MHRPFFLFGFAALAAGCASTPPAPLTAENPASPEAPEGAAIEHRTSLRADEVTRRSHSQLSAARREQEAWDKHGPVSGTPEDVEPEVKHEHH